MYSKDRKSPDISTTIELSYFIGQSEKGMGIGEKVKRERERKRDRDRDTQKPQSDIYGKEKE